jgi:uncharacterized membrane protein
MFNCRRLLRRHRDEERGATLVLTAVSMVALLGAGAMGVDVGFTVYGSRTAQAMADTAALDLVQDLDTADSLSTNTAVQTYLNSMLAGVATDNGSNAVLTATPGVWQNGAFLPPSGGCAGTIFITGSACNAIQVTANQTVPQVFWGGFNTLSGHSGSTSSTTVAAWTPESAFSIGSYLASIDTQQTAVLNVLLSTIGTPANVTAVGYQGLTNTYVSVNQLITASGGLLTTSNVMTTTLTGTQWLAIFSNAVANEAALTNCGTNALPCNASTALSGLDFGASASAQLCQMVSVKGSSCSNGSLSTAALNANVDVLQTLTTEAELANGTNALNVQAALALPGVTSASLYLTLIQPAQVAYGPVGSSTTASPCPATTGQTSTCATTAQVQSDLKLTVSGQVLDIPLSAATGYATLNSVACTNNLMTNVKINVATTATSGAVTLGGTNIATLTVNAVSNKAGSYTTVPPTASTASGATNPRNFGSTTPLLNYTGLSGASPVYNLLTSILPPVLGPVLQVTGATVGGAQVADLSARCDVVSLVQ